MRHLGILKYLVIKCIDDDYLFRNARGTPLTRFGIYRLVQKAGVSASSSGLTLRSRGISPHIIRHTTAVHFLRAGVDINTIRAWLGHVSIETTNIYAETDLAMKAKAIAACAPNIDYPSHPKRWPNDPDLLTFLRQL